MNLQSLFQNYLKQSLINVACERGVAIDPQKANDYFGRTAQSKLAELTSVILNDGQQADIFGGLSMSRVDPLVMEVARISFLHFCVTYAEEILDNCTVTANNN